MRKSLKIGLVIIFFGLGFILGMLYIKSQEVKIDKPSVVAKEKLENSKNDANEETTDITLYFGQGEDSSEIVKEERLVDNEELIGEIIMQELIKGPATVSEGKALIPKDTRLLNFSISEGIAHINFSGEIKTNMTQNEEDALLKSITTSMMQLASVSKVLITVDSERVETLGGNFNIYEPFGVSDIPSLLIKD